MDPLLRNALEACRSHFVNAAIFSLFLNCLFLAPTLYMLQVYDRVVPTGGVMTLVFLTLILAVALLTLTQLDLLRGRVLMRSAIRLDNILAGQILNRLFAKAAGGGRTNAYAGVMREFETFKNALSGPGVVALFDVPWAVIYLALCFMLHPYLGALSLGGGGLLALLTWLNEKATHKQLTSSSQAMAASYAQQESLASRADVVRALGMRRQLVTLQLRDRRLGLKESMGANLTGGLYTNLSKFFRLLLQSLALGIGAWLAVEHKISAGTIFAASLLMSRALQPMEQIIANWRGLTKGYNAFIMLDEFLKKIDVEPDLTVLPAPTNVLRVEGLTCVNSETRRYYLNNVSFEIQAGEVLGVLGPSGAGKTTLARAVVGADDYDFGNIRFDGAERREWDSERLAKHIGFLPQDTTLFPGSIRDNICRFENAVEDDQSDIDTAVIAAAKAAGAHDLILNLPNGYNTVLGPGGIGLSAGQAQRMGLARALYRDPFLLVLDEPNSHLDQEGETMLAKAIGEVTKRGGCVLVIAHRTAVLREAQKLLVLQNGRVSFFGSTAEWADLQQKRAVTENSSVGRESRSAIAANETEEDDRKRATNGQI